MARIFSLLQDGTLTYQQDGQLLQVVVETASWFRWLETASTFTFHSEYGNFTARSERAANKRGEMYWRAYRKRDGKLRRANLGKSQELTLARLEAVAVRLAAIDHPDRLFQRVIADLPADFPPLRTRVSHTSKLPAQLTSLIGREQEVEAVSALLEQPATRLVTLLGPGGVGKTRVALQVAASLQASFAGEITFVQLASVSDATLVIQTIAEALEIPQTGAESLFERVKFSLQGRRVLLVLDNFEQVIAASPQMAALLAASPTLTLLVTSRAALHVAGEREYPLTPLTLPSRTPWLAPEELMRYAAVELFVQRAQAALPTFGLTRANVRAIAEICITLDGLPLAIELAAARVKLLPPPALLKRLLQWSYDLLTEAERRLFRQLAVFVGGCTLEAVEAVCYLPEREASPMLDEVTSLLDKSLLQVELGGRGTTPGHVDDRTRVWR